MAGVVLSKGGNVSFTRFAPGLTEVVVGLGWDAHTAAGADVDLDASALGCDPDSQVVSDEWFVFFNNPASPDRSVQHLGTRSGDGDDEQIALKLDQVPGDVDRIVFVVSIYDVQDDTLSFDQVRNAFIRVVDRVDGTELARYELSADALIGTAVVFGEIYRNAGEWKFRAIGEGYSSGLAGVARDHGVNV